MLGIRLILKLVDTDGLSSSLLRLLPQYLARKPKWWVCLLLALSVTAVFWGVSGHEFTHYDDDGYVTENFHVQAGLTWKGLAWAFGQVHGEQTYWHPLTWVSHMLDCQLFGLKPAGHHLVNLFFHTLNTLLIFLVLGRLTGAFWQCGLVAALFALHPLQVDTVAWVAERKNLLSTFFGLLCLWAYALFAECRMQNAECRIEKPRGGVSQYASLYYVLSLLSFALGLMSKPVLVTLPFVLLLLDYWPLRRFPLSTINLRLRAFLGLVWEKAPFFFLGGVSCIITLVAHRGLGMLQAAARLPFDLRLENAVVSYVRYLGKTIWPFNLAIFYPYPGAWPAGQVILSSLLLLGVSGLAVYAAQSRPWLFVGWFWFLGMLVPFIGLVQAGKQAMADRFMYVPLIGVSIILVWGLAEFCRWLCLAQKGIAFFCGAILGLCAARTMDQLRCWQNSETLFRHAVAVSKDNCVALDGLGVALFGRGRLDEAMECYRQSLKINPADAHALNNLGAALEAKGSPEAIDWYRKALQADPAFPDALYNLGTAEAGQKHYAEAIKLFEAVLVVQPNHLEARNNLGNTFANLGRPEEAIAQYRLALQLQPKAARIHCNLAALLVSQGKLDEAALHYRQALTHTLNDGDTHHQLGIALALQEKWDEAIEQYRATLRHAPNNAEVRYNLGYALRVRGRVDEAIAELAEAVRLKADFPLAQYNLGCALAEKGRREEAVAHLREALRRKADYREARRALERLGAKPKVEDGK